MRIEIILVGTAATALACHGAEVTVASIQGTAAGGFSAEAVFTYDTVTNQLCIELSNAAVENTDPNWLTGLFWNMTGTDLEKSDYDASGVEGDMYTFPDGTNAGKTAYTDHTADQFWAFKNNIDSNDIPFGDQSFGLGAAGFDVFSGADMLVAGGPHPQPDGVDGGIVADFPDLSISQKSTEFIQSSLLLKFTLTGYVGDGTDISIDDVWFQYGSGFGEEGFNGMVIPLPAGGAMAGAGLLIVGMRRRRCMV